MEISNTGVSGAAPAARHDESALFSTKNDKDNHFEKAAAAKRTPEQSEVDAAVQALNEKLAPHALEARYSVDDKSHRIIIKIVNTTSGELVRQLPSEAAVRLAEAAATSPGIAPASLIDEKA
jgi:flagellar protein FlaG